MHIKPFRFDIAGYKGLSLKTLKKSDCFEGVTGLHHIKSFTEHWPVQEDGAKKAVTQEPNKTHLLFANNV